VTAAVATAGGDVLAEALVAEALVAEARRQGL